MEIHDSRPVDYRWPIMMMKPIIYIYPFVLYTLNPFFIPPPPKYFLSYQLHFITRSAPITYSKRSNWPVNKTLIAGSSYTGIEMYFSHRRHLHACELLCHIINLSYTGLEKGPFVMASVFTEPNNDMWQHLLGMIQWCMEVVRVSSVEGSTVVMSVTMLNSLTFALIHSVRCSTAETLTQIMT